MVRFERNGSTGSAAVGQSRGRRHGLRVAVPIPVLPPHSSRFSDRSCRLTLWSSHARRCGRRTGSTFSSSSGRVVSTAVTLLKRRGRGRRVRHFEAVGLLQRRRGADVGPGLRVGVPHPPTFPPRGPHRRAVAVRAPVEPGSGGDVAHRPRNRDGHFGVGRRHVAGAGPVGRRLHRGQRHPSVLSRPYRTLQSSAYRAAVEHRRFSDILHLSDRTMLASVRGGAVVAHRSLAELDLRGAVADDGAVGEGGRRAGHALGCWCWSRAMN